MKTIAKSIAKSGSVIATVKLVIIVFASIDTIHMVHKTQNAVSVVSGCSYFAFFCRDAWTVDHE